MATTTRTAAAEDVAYGMVMCIVCMRLSNPCCRATAEKWKEAEKRRYQHVQNVGCVANLLFWSSLITMPFIRRRSIYQSERVFCHSKFSYAVALTFSLSHHCYFLLLQLHDFQRNNKNAYWAMTVISLFQRMYGIFFHFFCAVCVCVRALLCDGKKSVLQLYC